MDWLMHPYTSRCHLLNLPPELRDAIYEFALVADKTLVTFKLDSYQRDSYQQATQPALTQVSRQLRVETLPIWYGCNHFVLHTEGEKARNARDWLRCNERHLSKLKNASIWVRYVTLTYDRSSQGAMSLALQRGVTTGCWRVNDECRWITVVRKPASFESDAKRLVGQLRRMLVKESTSQLGADEFADMLVDLRSEYVKEKTS